MKSHVNHRSSNAFTLIELMIVVTIIGILAAVAMPMVSKYVRKSKTAEAAVNLRKIYDGEAAYYVMEISTIGGTLISKQFVSLPLTPSGLPSKDKRSANWDAAGWGAIRFQPDGAVLYAYTVDASGTGAEASFTARAIGDTDDDGKTSLFERIATVNSSSGEVTGGAAIYMLDELE